MQHRRSALGAVTALPGSASATSLDMVLPVRAQHNGILGSVNGGTIHTKSLELVELLAFASFPLVPCVHGLELPSSEVS